MSLQEAIFRGLGGSGPYTPGPRPTTQLDVLAGGMLAAPAAAVLAVKGAAVLAAIETSGPAIALGVQVIQTGTRLPWLRAGLALFPYMNRTLGSYVVQTLGFSEDERVLFQILLMAGMAVQADPAFPSCGGR
jgi:hypothetical protein